MTNAIVVLWLLAAAQPVVAGQVLPPPRPTAHLGALRPAQSSDPYRKLFGVQGALKAGDSATPKGDLKPAVVCGLTIIPADPSIDPKMLFPRKADRIDYKIRVMASPICTPSR